MFRARILSFMGWVIVSLWSRTVGLRFENKATPERLATEGKNIIYAFWHGRQFLLFHSHRDSGIIIPASESRDGEIQARILKRFGFEVVRGSSKRKGDRALLGLVDGLRKGRNIAVAVDGPRGPACEVKPGVMYLSGKLGKPIVPVASSARRYWVMAKVWDKLLLPRPFTTGVIIYGNPIWVRGTAEEELEAKREELEAALRSLTSQADEYFGKRASVEY